MTESLEGSICRASADPAGGTRHTEFAALTRVRDT